MWIGLGVVCLLGVAIVLSPFAARRDPAPTSVIDTAAITRELAAVLAQDITALDKKQDERTKILEGAVIKLIDKVQPIAVPAKPVQPPASANPAPATR